MVLWNEQFECGSPRIDQQHRMLINNINHLEEMLGNTNFTPEECNFLIHLVGFLESYAETHFQFEEQCMEQFRCPVHHQNKQAHERFRTIFQGFRQRCQAEGLRPDVLKGLHLAASAWIEEHILRVDTQLRPCIKKN